VTISAEASKKGLGWALAPASLLATMFVGLGIMLSYALDDPGFGVEPNYYEKAVHFDEHQALERESRALAWSIELESNMDPEGAHIAVTLRDHDGKPVEGAFVKAVAFHNARSSRLYELEFRGAGAGRYTSLVSPWRPGVWEFRFEVVRASARFLQVMRVDLEGL
jgi:nitrogen fixation protein FixH